MKNTVQEIPRDVWEKEANTGQPTSSSPPPPPEDLVTPSRRHPSFFEVDATTPETKPLLPYRKAQVTAKKRMEAQLRQAKKGQGVHNEDAKGASAMNKGKSKDKKNGSTSKNKKNTSKGKKDKNTKDKKDKSTKDKKDKSTKGKGKEHQHGPMGQQMAAFLAKLKAQGFSHQEAMAAWVRSDVRRGIIEKMGPAERKRRRFELHETQ